MNILFWIGYNSPLYDGNTTTGLGGTEVGVINISKGLSAHGYNVTVAGQCKNSGLIDGVEWIDIDSFEAKYSQKPNHFDMVVGVNYLHFLKYMDMFNQSPKLIWFWVHNTEYYKWFNGEEMSQEDCEVYLNRIPTVVTPSQWAFGRAIKDWYATPSRKGEGIAVANGINTAIFKNANVVKDPNKFIWSSAVDRGLSDLLDNWPRVKKVKPNATLDIYYPAYSNPHEEGSWYNIDNVLDKIEDLKDLGVTDMGSVSQDQLHYAMLKASYWMYLTKYEETFCITALEMMAAGVLPICSNTAALRELVFDGIIVEKDDVETMFDIGIQTLGMLDSELKEKAIASARRMSDHFSWSEISRHWYMFIQQRLQKL